MLFMELALHRVFAIDAAVANTIARTCWFRVTSHFYRVLKRPIKRTSASVFFAANGEIIRARSGNLRWN